MTPDRPAPLPWWARALDLLSGTLLILALLVFCFGGFREYVFGVRLSLTSWSRLVIAALMIAALRHAIVRVDPVYRRFARALRRVRSSSTIQAAARTALATRISVLIAGYLAVVMIGFGPGGAVFRVSDNEILNLPARWDAGWYLTIVQHGYVWGGNPQAQQNVVFFPMLPALMYVTGLFFNRQWLIAGTLLSIAAFFWALTYLFRLTRERLGEDGAHAALWFIAAYPFAVYFSAAYTESLFLLGVLAACYHFERQQSWRAAAWGLFAGLCRPNGFFLAVPLALLLIGRLFPGALRGWVGRAMLSPRARADGSSESGGRAARFAQMAAIVAPVVGAGLYSAYLYARFGDPLAWTRGQLGWGRVYGGVWSGLEALVVDRQSFVAEHGLYAYSLAQPMDLMNSVAAVFALVALVPVAWRFGPAYGAFIAMNLFPPLIAGGTLSIGRMTSVFFPIFVWLAAVVAPRRRTAWFVAFAVLQGLIATLFYTWRPAF